MCMSSPNDNKVKDSKGNIRHIHHSLKPIRNKRFELNSAPQSSRELADKYIIDIAPVYGIKRDLLTDLGLKPDDTSRLSQTENDEKIQFANEKHIMNTSVISYSQTFAGIPIYQAGLAVTINDGMGVVSSQNTIHYDIKVEKPSDNAPFLPDKIDIETLKNIFNIDTSSKWQDLKINSKKIMIYKFDADLRLDPSIGIPEEKNHNIPLLPVSPLPQTIKDGEHYVISEIYFSTMSKNNQKMNWRTFLEINNGYVLFLRALVADIYRPGYGLIYENDPCTVSGNNTILPTSSADLLDSLRKYRVLPEIDDVNPRKLTGRFIKLIDKDPPNIVSPEVPLPGKFYYSVPTNEFAAVNAYYHCDGLFRTVERMGFNISEYFDGTSFPVPVDHRSNFEDEDCPNGNCVNAQAPGNEIGNGSGGFKFALINSKSTVGIAVDKRVAWHEFGHALLWDSVHSPNFGFAHSAGDSLAAILSDPGSKSPDRYLTFPWVSILSDPASERSYRRHDRKVSDGWAWGGPKYGPFNRNTDPAGYLAEQILSTTLFKIYQSLGGDASSIGTKKFAANYMSYLIIRAIGSLATEPVTITPIPDIFATTLINADLATQEFEGNSGGFLHKVIRWGFEKQGLYQPKGSTTPVMTEGAPPNVDVYIDDGRKGEYNYEKRFWDCKDIWNRLSPDNGQGNESPKIGVTNYLYAKIKNRGDRSARNIVVKGFQSKSSIPLSFPDDWKTMKTDSMQISEELQSKKEIVVGPIEWIPELDEGENVMVSVSCEEDLSNIDLIDRSIPNWLLIPFDNNIAQRDLSSQPSLVSQGNKETENSSIIQKILIKNPYSHPIRLNIEHTLHELPSDKLNLSYFDNEDNVFVLRPQEEKEIMLNIEYKHKDFGKEFEDIDLLVVWEGKEIGGTTLRIK